MTKYNFDRTKPFYPIVMSFTSSLMGLKELAAAGLPEFKQELDLNGMNSEEAELFIRRSKKLLGPLELPVTGDMQRLVLDRSSIAQELVANHDSLFESFTRLALMSLALAHEVTLKGPYRNRSPMWEFLRHCRNGLSHNGKWHFLNGEPKHVAEWRGIVLDVSMHGTPIFQLPQSPQGSLQIGDVIAILHDLETAFPAMTV